MIQPFWILENETLTVLATSDRWERMMGCVPALAIAFAYGCNGGCRTRPFTEHATDRFVSTAAPPPQEFERGRYGALALDDHAHAGADTLPVNLGAEALNATESIPLCPARFRGHDNRRTAGRQQDRRRR
ncbi:hypothetical protein OG21DRAFT_1244781 [Imleria badia]|nr:hypothetical protein OG21DRAFT_1244781 [Imleria badia]